MKIHASVAAALALALALAGTAAAQTNPDSSLRGTSTYGTPPAATSGTYNNSTTGGAYDNNTSGTTTSSTTAGGSLPHTASPMPLFSLLGSAATAAGLWLSQLRRPRH
jgi:hypothetical protein